MQTPISQSQQGLIENLEKTVVPLTCSPGGFSPYPSIRLQFSRKVRHVVRHPSYLALNILPKNGEIIAQGTYEELMTSSPLYQEIYESQLGGGITAGLEVSA